MVKHNKQFNSDSQRLALSPRVEFSVYGALFKFSVCAAHTLIGRYISKREKFDICVFTHHSSGYIDTILHS